MPSAQPHVMIDCMVASFSWKKKVTLPGRGGGVCEAWKSVFRALYLSQLQGCNLNFWEESHT